MKLIANLLFRDIDNIAIGDYHAIIARAALLYPVSLGRCIRCLSRLLLLVLEQYPSP